MSKHFTHIKETFIAENNTHNQTPKEPEESGCVGLVFIFLLFMASIVMCSSTYSPYTSTNSLVELECINSLNTCSAVDSVNLVEKPLVNDGIEVMISLWIDKSRSAAGIVPNLTYEHLGPIFRVFQQLESASLSIGKVGSSTRSDMAFLAFSKGCSISVPKRKAGQSPSDYQKELLRYKKRKSRSSNGTSYEDKIDDFEVAARTILESPKNESQSLICEAYNVSKRQFSQKNVDENTVKIVVILSDMFHNGTEKCPLSLGDAEVIIVNRLSDPTRLLLHSNTNHFISVEEAIDYIVSII
jgi:hypothetical protein